jgi:hypothetical protein
MVLHPSSIFRLTRTNRYNLDLFIPEAWLEEEELLAKVLSRSLSARGVCGRGKFGKLITGFPSSFPIN